MGMKFLWLLFIVVCLVVWTRDKKEPFEVNKITDFFELVDPYMEEVKQLYNELKNTDATIDTSIIPWPR
jgi:hypothetical protein